MDSVDKLREYAAYNCRVKGWKDDLKSLADGIEAEVESEYMKLPVDADGVTIHVGDNLHSDETGRDFPCRGYNLTLQGSKKWWTVECCYDSYSGTSEYVSAKSCHHVKPRTLEDVLHDFWEEWESHPIDAEWGERLERLRESEAKYADEIRELMEGGVE